jgi:CBF1 interacting corepressor
MKGFHPGNKQNQKLIWIAEQKAKEKEQREKDAAKEVLKNQDLEHFKQVAALKGDLESVRKVQAQQVGFMYAPPPGLKKVDKQNDTIDAKIQEGQSLSIFLATIISYH